MPLTRSIQISLLVSFLFYHGSQAVETTYRGNVARFFATNKNPNDQAIFIDKIICTADIPINQYEFFYITDLKEHTTITKADLNTAFRRLMAKNRYDNISFDTKEEGGKTNLHVHLCGQWLFNKVVVHGVWFGASSITNLYLQQPGQPFDPLNHEESIKNIKTDLNDQGYFNCSVQDKLLFDSPLKTITTKLFIKKNRQYKVAGLTINTKTDRTGNMQALLKNGLTQAHSDLVGSFFSKKAIIKYAKKCKNTLKKHGYSSVKIFLKKNINHKKQTVSVALRIHTDTQRNITCSGNTVLPTSYILEDIIAEQIPDWLFSPDVLAQQLLHEYYKKGYWRAQIRYKKTGDNAFHFTIIEGSPLPITAVEIQGIDHPLPQPVKKLIDNLQQSSADQATINTILDEIKTWYLTNGYWNFTVNSKDFVKNSDKKSYLLKLHLTEGAQRLWSGFKIKNNKSLAQHEFFRKFRKPTQGQVIPCNIAWIGEQRQFILNHYLQQGYWYADVQPKIIIIDQNKAEQAPTTERVFVSWDINPGQLVKFGKTIVQGHSSVPFHRIQKHLSFAQGDVWDRKKIEISRKRLRKLNVFKSIHIQPAQLTKKQNKKNIFINLVDDDPIELRARIGYYFNSGNRIFNEQNTAKVGASFIVKNPTNRADSFGIEGDWSSFERRFTMNYQQPAPLDLSGTGKALAYLNQFNHPVEIKQSGSAYQALIYGARASLENEYKEHYFWNIGFGNEWAKITKVQGNLKFDQRLLNKQLPSFFIEPRITIDMLDDRVNTTRGAFTQAAIKFIVPEHKGDLEAKISFEQTLFYPLHERFILAGRFNFGHIFRGKFEKIIPHERFYLGGPNTVRGYGQDSIPPLGTSQRTVNDTTIIDYTIQGGSSMINANLELRYNLYKAIGITLFHDIGILSQDGIEGLRKRWYPGSGIGFRYKTPIGAIRFDAGWKWKKRLPLDSMAPEFYITFNEAF
jgi:outer membrane protein assembly factor BamA